MIKDYVGRRTSRIFENDFLGDDEGELSKGTILVAAVDLQYKTLNLVQL